MAVNLTSPESLFRGSASQLRAGDLRSRAADRARGGRDAFGEIFDASLDDSSAGTSRRADVRRDDEMAQPANKARTATSEPVGYADGPERPKPADRPRAEAQSDGAQSEAARHDPDGGAKSDTGPSSNVTRAAAGDTPAAKATDSATGQAVRESDASAAEAEGEATSADGSLADDDALDEAATHVRHAAGGRLPGVFKAVHTGGDAAAQAGHPSALPQGVAVAPTAVALDAPVQIPAGVLVDAAALAGAASAGATTSTIVSQDLTGEALTEADFAAEAHAAANDHAADDHSGAHDETAEPHASDNRSDRAVTTMTVHASGQPVTEGGDAGSSATPVITTSAYHALAARLDLATHAAPPEGARGSQPTSESMDRLVQSMRLQSLKGGGDAIIQIRPEHLGGVAISIKVENGAVSAVFTAEHAAVAEWLQSNQHLLREGLQGSGLELGRLVVQRDGESPYSGHDHAADSRRQPRRRPTQPESTFEIIL